MNYLTGDLNLASQTTSDGGSIQPQARFLPAYNVPRGLGRAQPMEKDLTDEAGRSSLADTGRKSPGRQALFLGSA